MVRGPLTIAASLVAEHKLQTRRLSNCGSRAQLLRGMWDLPRAGLELVSPALAGRFSTTAPPGKPNSCFLTSSFYPQSISSFFFLINCIFIFGCVGSLLRAQAFSSCSKRGPLFIVVHRLLIAVACLVEHGL